VHPAQVLKELEDPCSPGIIATLRRVARSLSHSQADTTKWQCLLPGLLGVLASLPAGRPPSAAAEVCAAAVCALNNLYKPIHYVAPASDAFRTTLAANEAACRAIVRWGLACPEASEQLPPGAGAVFVYDLTSIPEHMLDAEGRAFWTPFTLTTAFLTILSLTPGASTPGQVKLHARIVGAVTPNVVERLLRVAVEYSCSACPPMPVRPPGVLALTCRAGPGWRGGGSIPPSPPTPMGTCGGVVEGGGVFASHAAACHCGPASVVCNRSAECICTALSVHLLQRNGVLRPQFAPVRCHVAVHLLRTPASDMRVVPTSSDQQHVYHNLAVAPALSGATCTRCPCVMHIDRLLHS
jgi:hypothetical protein